MLVSTITIPADKKEELWREGWIVPQNEENAHFWSTENLRMLNKSIRQGEEGALMPHELIEI